MVRWSGGQLAHVLVLPKQSALTRIRVVFQPILFQFVAEGGEAEAENFGGLAAVTARFLEGLLQQVDFEAGDDVIELKRFFHETFRASLDQKLDRMAVVKLGREILQVNLAESQTVPAVA